MLLSYVHACIQPWTVVHTNKLCNNQSTISINHPYNMLNTMHTVLNIFKTWNGVCDDLFSARTRCLSNTDAQHWFRPSVESVYQGFHPIYQHPHGAEISTLNTIMRHLEAEINIFNNLTDDHVSRHENVK